DVVQEDEASAVVRDGAEDMLRHRQPALFPHRRHVGKPQHRVDGGTAGERLVDLLEVHRVGDPVRDRRPKRLVAPTATDSSDGETALHQFPNEQTPNLAVGAKHRVHQRVTLASTSGSASHTVYVRSVSYRLGTLSGYDPRTASSRHRGSLLCS